MLPSENSLYSQTKAWSFHLDKMQSARALNEAIAKLHMN